MKIAININELTLKQNTGVKVYTREIVKALKEVDGENEYLLYGNGIFKIELSKPGFGYPKPSFDSSILKIPFWTYTKFPQEIKKDKPDILFMPIQATPFFRKPKDIKLVVTVHDLAFLLFPKHFTFKDRLLLNFHTKRAIKMADKIIVPSMATKNDIVRFYNISESRIEVVYHGVETRHCLVSTAISNTSCILFVGSVQPRKNLVKLIEAFEILKRRRDEAVPRLYIVGAKGWLSDEIYKKAEESEFSKQIIFKGSVSDNELVDLYKNASIFVMPSLYEGFGLPVLEAMSYGIPCVVSDNSSLREITCNGQACLSTTGDANDIAEKINTLLTNEKLRKELSEKGIENVKRFSWKKSAEKMVEIFEKVK